MWFLGVDIGTTHIKVVGITGAGEVLHPVKVRTPVLNYQGHTWHEADAVWDAVAGLTRDYALTGPAASSGPLAGVCVASFGQEESFPVDVQGTALHASLAWWERRRERSIAEDIAQYLDSFEHYAVSGMRLRGNQSPERIAYLQKHEPALWARTDKWVDFGSYVTWKLTGSWVTSATQVTHSQMFDVKTLTPHRESMERLGVRPEQFAHVAHPGTRAGRIKPEALEGIELAPDAAAYVGGHDQVLATYANSVEGGSNVVDSIGTAEYLMVTSKTFSADRRLYELAVDIEPGWTEGLYVMGWGLPTGKILQLLADLFTDGDFERLMEALASEGPLIDVDFAVSDLRTSDAGLISIGRIPAGARTRDLLRSSITQLSVRIRRTLELMANVSGTTIGSVTLTGSLFQRTEMVSHRERTWRLPLRVSALEEAVATGAATMARSAHTREPLPMKVPHP